MRPPRLYPISTSYAALRPRSRPLLVQCRHNSDAAPIPPKQEYSTPLAEQLAGAIKTTGPIPIASYMRQCLTSESGYYTAERAQGGDQFGRRGDFVTSPEISQMFGEMVGAWIVSEWMLQDRSWERVQLIELGPGRGTLMSDVMRVLNQISFTKLRAAMDGIYLVEASTPLREAQHALLCNPATAPMKPMADGLGYTAMSREGIPITWCSTLSHVPQFDGVTPLILAHEFFDALPIHTFQATRAGWRELLVNVTPPDATHTSLRTPRSQQVLGAPLPEFALVKAKTPTKHSLILPELSERYKLLSKTPGAIIEVSPETLTTAHEMAARIGKARRGGALIIDYGPRDSVPVNSLRGIKSHRLVSPFHEAGAVDLSADVDFMGIVEHALAASEGVETHGPVDQRSFLVMMGIQYRMERLLNAANGEEERLKVERSYYRLIDGGINGMGKTYKALAIVPERDGRRPVGFGGHLSPGGE